MKRTTLVNKLEQVRSELLRYGVHIEGSPDDFDGLAVDMEDMTVLTSAKEIWEDWSDNFDSPLFVHIGNSANVSTVLRMAGDKANEEGPMDAIRRLMRLVYHTMSRAGFSLDWTGEIGQPIMVRRPYDGEAENN